MGRGEARAQGAGIHLWLDQNRTYCDARHRRAATVAVGVTGPGERESRRPMSPHTRHFSTKGHNHARPRPLRREHEAASRSPHTDQLPREGPGEERVAGRGREHGCRVPVGKQGCPVGLAVALRHMSVLPSLQPAPVRLVDLRRQSTPERPRVSAGRMGVPSCPPCLCWTPHRH